MSVRRHFSSYTAARTHLREVLDAAHAGVVTTVRRDRERYVVLDAEDLREQLARLLPSQAVVVAEAGGWSAFVPGVPVHGDAVSFDEAVRDLVEGLREYAQDWNEDLRTAPNHRQHRALVQLVERSSDAQLRDWLLDSASDAEQPPVSA
jgi:hypothetical protein